jgi:putative DNA primase/helicase
MAVLEKARFALPPSVGQGERENTMYKYALSLQGKGLDDQLIEDKVLSANESVCTPPLTQGEVLTTVRGVTSSKPKGHSAELEAELAERGKGTRTTGIHLVSDDALTNFVKGGDITDLSLSCLFASRYRCKLRYIPFKKGGTFVCYDGTRWVLDGAESMAEGLMKNFVADLNEAYRPFIDLDNQQSVKRGKALASYKGYRRREDLLKDARPELRASLSDFDRDSSLFNVKNGTLDLSKYPFELRQHKADDMITMVAGCSYDPKASCDEWSNTIAEIHQLSDGSEDAEKIQYVQKMCGLAIAGDMSLERFHIAYGVTRSGKSTLLETLLAMMGDYGCAMQYQTLAVQKRSSGGTSGDVARLDGKRFVVVSEPKQAMNLDEALVKQLTGGNTVTARGLYEDDRDFKPHFSMWLDTNHLPLVRDQTVFESDRVVVVPHERHFEQGERDPKLKDRLQQEQSLSAVLNWCLAGLSCYKLDGAEFPQSIREATESYAASSDILGRFLMLRMTKRKGSFVRGSKVFSAFCNMCDEENVSRPSQSFFYQTLRERGIFRDQLKIDGQHFNSVVVGYAMD